MYKRAVVAIDGSETSEHAFDAGLQLLASGSGAQWQPLDVVDNTLDWRTTPPATIQRPCMTRSW
jgi:nucleotide-binding universal stress UspA family protein